MFVNPFTMFLGGLLISSPIIIHLINRIRYKRVRWAAMEFLLKSQKRTRRKMIIEQLILLFLRIMMVVLVALLLARFLGFNSSGATEDKYTKHIIILDDTPSMGDISRGADGKSSEAFEHAKDAINKIVKEANSAPSGQYFQILRLSELEDRKGDFGKLNDSQVSAVANYLKTLKLGSTHVDLIKGLEAAETIFSSDNEGKKHLYVVSDFRTTDWPANQDRRLKQKFAELQAAQVQPILFDVAGPERNKSELQKPPVYSDNLAIIDFRPASRIAVDGDQTDFTMTVANYSTGEKSAFVKIRVNGKEKLDRSQNIPHIAPNQTVTIRFPITLTLDSADVPKEVRASKLWQLKRFNIVTAQIQKQEDEPGLSIDDQRYTVVDVRNRIPILVVDNAASEHRKKGSESFYIYKVFRETYKGYDVQFATAAQLDKMNLQPFSSIMLCNIPKLEPAARKNLEDYVANGGGVAFFMGPAITETDVKFYNESLYNSVPVYRLNSKAIAALAAGGLPDLVQEKLKIYLVNKEFLKEEDFIAALGGVLTKPELQSYQSKIIDKAKTFAGLFPVPLEAKPKNADLSEKELNDVVREMIKSNEDQLLIRKENRFHPALVRLFDEAKLAKGEMDTDFTGMTRKRAFAQYFQINRRALINDDKEDTIDVLMNLPYFGSSQRGKEGDGQQADKSLLNRVMDLLKKLPLDKDEFAKYREQLTALKKIAEEAIREPKVPMPDKAAALRLLLEPQEDPEKPSLRTMWEHPDMAELYTNLKLAWEDMRYGDPIYVAKTFGKGRVLCWLGSAGSSWNPSEAFYYPPFLRDSVQAYLGSSGTDLNLTLQTPYEFTVDPTIYATTANKWFVREKAVASSANQAQIEVATTPEPRDSQVLNTITTPGETKPKALSLVFNEGTEPGVYLFEFIEQRPNAAGQIDKISDFRALTYNFDTSAESNLSRAATSDLQQTAAVTNVYTSSSNADLTQILNKKPADLSEKSWLYLLILFVMIAEQAMAVRLSFHSRPAEEHQVSVPVMTGRGVVTA
jgi:hypothetical protein